MFCILEIKLFLINGPTGIACSKIAVQEADDQQALLIIHYYS